MGNFRFILDRPHCKEHLSKAGEELEPMTGQGAQQWAGECSRPTAGGTNIGRAAELAGGNGPSSSPVHARPTPHDALGYPPVLP
jgi:hypothetical protein